MKFLIFILLLFISSSVTQKESYLSPVAILNLESKNLLAIAYKTCNRIDLVNTRDLIIKNSIKLKHNPTGLCISNDIKFLFITAGEGEGMLYIIDLISKKIKFVVNIGHSPCSPVLIRKDVLVFCDRFANKVSFLNLQTNRIIKIVDVSREPISIDFDGNHKQLIVAHHLPDDAATSDLVSSEISFIDTEKMELIKHVSMPNGSSSLKQIKVAPGGRYAVVSHILARYNVHTSQLEQGWQNTNAITLIDLEKQNIYHTVLLDDVKQGAANPWGIEFDKDGETLFVTHAGTNELSIINYQKLLEILKEYPSTPGHYSRLNDPSNKLSFVRDCRERYKLKGEGPRSMAVSSTELYIGQYFTDAVEVVDFNSTRITSKLILLNKIKPNLTRKGEMLFNSAKICFENWQSCSSCHPEGRADGFNWDLLNDGIGNPKNTLSLLYSHQTPPVMSTGVREKAEVAVRTGMKYIMFMDANEEDAQAIDTYLANMRPVPSPYLIENELSESAQNGKVIFQKAGCADCHNGLYMTDQKMYDVGTSGKYDFRLNSEHKLIPQKEFDTPVLMEIWRTAPYLHDGRYYTIEELFTKGYHGLIKKGNITLNESDVRQLADYLRSL